MSINATRYVIEMSTDIIHDMTVDVYEIWIEDPYKIRVTFDKNFECVNAERCNEPRLKAQVSWDGRMATARNVEAIKVENIFAIHCLRYVESCEYLKKQASTVFST